MRRITSKTWVASSSGRAVHTHAAAAATIGEAKLVPSTCSYRLGLSHAGTAATIDSPGATTSMPGEVDEKAVTAPFPATAPTVSTCARLAG